MSKNSRNKAAFVLMVILQLEVMAHLLSFFVVFCHCSNPGQQYIQDYLAGMQVYFSQSTHSFLMQYNEQFIYHLCLLLFLAFLACPIRHPQVF